MVQHPLVTSQNSLIHEFGGDGRVAADGVEWRSLRNSLNVIFSKEATAKNVPRVHAHVSTSKLHRVVLLVYRFLWRIQPSPGTSAQDDNSAGTA